MPRTKASELPKLITYTKSGRKYAEVRLPMADGRRERIALGPDGPEALERYRRTIARWIESDRRWSPGRTLAKPRTAALTAGQLGELYLEHARGYYVKPAADGSSTPTQSAGNIARALELLERAPRPDHPRRSIASLPAGQLGPLALDAYRIWLAAHPAQRWSRRTINTYASWIVSMIRWGVSRQLVPPEQLTALEALPALRRGRRPAPGVAVPREADPVPAATPEQIAATAAELTPTLSRAVQLHALTGMRILELLELRICHLYHRDGRRLWPAELEREPPEALLYRVPEHADKTAHVESRPGRRIALGPIGRGLVWAQLADARIVHEQLGTELASDAAVFDPRIADASRHLDRRAEALAAGRRVRPDPVKPRQSPKDTYTRASYRRAIVRAAERAGVPHWSPNQLRHTAATAIANAESLHIAQAILGHADLKTTRGYVDDQLERIIDAAARIG
jgi:integrase